MIPYSKIIMFFGAAYKWPNIWAVFQIFSSNESKQNTLIILVIIRMIFLLMLATRFIKTRFTNVSNPLDDVMITVI
jgi:maltodextrin utilization protein YvdJ